MPLPNPNIPQANDFLSTSQPQLLANNAAITTLVGGVFSTIANPATAATEVALFNKVVGANQELCFRRPTSGDIFPITDFTAGNPGFAFLPSGMLVKFGSGVTLAGGTTTVPYDATNAFNHVYSVQITLFMNPPVPTPTPWALVNFSNPAPLTQVQILNSAHVIHFYYFAIGTCLTIP